MDIVTEDVKHLTKEIHKSVHECNTYRAIRYRDKLSTVVTRFAKHIKSKASKMTFKDLDTYQNIIINIAENIKPLLNIDDFVFPYEHRDAFNVYINSIIVTIRIYMSKTITFRKLTDINNIYSNILFSF